MKKSKHIGRKLLIAAAVIFIAGLIVPFLVPIPPLENTELPQLADADSLDASIDGIDTHYKNSGQGETALLQLHGNPSNLFTWKEYLSQISQQIETQS